MSKFTDWWNRMFGKKKPTTTTTPVVPAPAPAPVIIAPTPTFVDTFKNLDNWVVSTWTAPQGGSNNHAGKFSAEYATISADGLCLKLTQSLSGSTITSIGSEIASKQRFGYGTYEFVVKASVSAAGSPVSGSITGCFNYLTSSATEIDIEIEGGTRSHITQTTSWSGESNPNEHFDVLPGGGTLPHESFHTYKFVWSPGKIVFWRDGAVIATHTKVVPSAAAPMMFNHWGTNNPNWGGTATPGVDRFMYVKSFSFTPL
jgi:beta-glucanase (GH16 family)